MLYALQEYSEVDVLNTKLIVLFNFLIKEIQVFFYHASFIDILINKSFFFFFLLVSSGGSADVMHLTHLSSHLLKQCWNSLTLSCLS